MTRFSDQRLRLVFTRHKHKHDQKHKRRLAIENTCGISITKSTRTTNTFVLLVLMLLSQFSPMSTITSSRQSTVSSHILLNIVLNWCRELRQEIVFCACVCVYAYVAGVLTRLSLFLCLCFSLCPCENQPYSIDKINICFPSPVDPYKVTPYLFVCLFVYLFNFLYLRSYSCRLLLVLYSYLGINIHCKSGSLLNCKERPLSDQ